MFAYVYNHVRVILPYVCACMFVCSGVEVYVYVHLRMGLYICLYVCIVCVYACMHMYVTIHDFMSVCERCM